MLIECSGDAAVVVRSRRWTSGWSACRGSPQMTALPPSAQPSRMSRHVCSRITSCGALLLQFRLSALFCAISVPHSSNDQQEKMPDDLVICFADARYGCEGSVKSDRIMLGSMLTALIWLGRHWLESVSSTRC